MWEGCVCVGGLCVSGAGLCVGGAGLCVCVGQGAVYSASQP